MNKILVIDDDKKLRELLQRYLTEQGFAVDACADPIEARAILASVEYDLLIVDVMMPNESGLDFTLKFKQTNDTPILMLTALGEVDHRIKGLEVGADDYLPKPFEPRELFLRAKKLIDKSQKSKLFATKQKSQIVTFGEFKFSLENHKLFKNSKEISLSSKESDLLKVLAQNVNQPVSRYDLSDTFNGISERSIDVQVTRLRRKIEDDPAEPKHIHTVWGKGYVLRS
jgi:two-component system phosphate regulon response regulator OmpR